MTLTRPESQILVVFGASGDLTHRKLMPALYDLYHEGLMPAAFGVVGYARTQWDDDGFRARARSGVEKFARTPVDDSSWDAFASSLHFVCGAFDEPMCMGPLDRHLHDLEERLGTNRRLYYCATPPSAFPAIVRRLGECGPQDGARIVVEKPFGRDAPTAAELNAVIRDVFEESQVLRIDHYLGKETVQNILVLRFANSLFERVWNRDAIDHVQITVAEQVGVEGRGAYYEEAGTLRDMVQNHLLQVLAILAMEPPRALEPEAIRDEKVKVLRALRPFEPASVVRGRYAAGSVGGVRVPGYLQEEGVAPGSHTETYVAVRALIDNWRWDGVPFYLRTGKRLARRATEVAIWFRRPPAYLFDSPPEPDHVILRIQPDEGVSLAFHVKTPGPGFTPQMRTMDFAYDARPVDAYQRLLYDAMTGDRTLFTREDGVARAWEVVAPVLDLSAEPYPYAAGTWGPAEADTLLAPATWHLC